MIFLTLDYIKAHSRIDFDCENELLEEYGSAAERAVLNLLGQSVDELKDTNEGEVPDDVMVATFQLAESLALHRSPTEQVNLSVVPYGIDLLLKPYIKL